MLTTGRAAAAGLTLAWPNEAAVGAGDGSELQRQSLAVQWSGSERLRERRPPVSRVMPASTPVILLKCRVVCKRNWERRDGSGVSRPGHRGPIRSLGGRRLGGRFALQRDGDHRLLSSLNRRVV